MLCKLSFFIFFFFSLIFKKWWACTAGSFDFYFLVLWSQLKSSVALQAHSRERWCYESCQCSDWLSPARNFPGRAVEQPFQCFYETWVILRCIRQEGGPMNKPVWGKLQALLCRMWEALPKSRFSGALRWLKKTLTVQSRLGIASLTI